MELEVRISGDDNRDAVARRLVRDLGDCDGIGAARLVTLAANPGDRGIVEDLGAVALSVLNASGAEALLMTLRAIIPRRRSLSPDIRKFSFKTPDGGQLDFEGAMSDVEFAKTKNQLIAMLKVG